MNHDRHDELSDLPERRVADRRISPAIGEFAIQQIPPLAAEIDRLREELKAALAMSLQDHASMLAALGESMRLREVNAKLLAALQKIAGGNVMVSKTGGESWKHEDTVVEYQKIASAAIAKAQTESAAAQEAEGDSTTHLKAGVPASAADHEPEAA